MQAYQRKAPGPTSCSRGPTTADAASARSSHSRLAQMCLSPLIRETAANQYLLLTRQATCAATAPITEQVASPANNRTRMGEAQLSAPPLKHGSHSWKLCRSWEQASLSTLKHSLVRPAARRLLNARGMREAGVSDGSRHTCMVKLRTEQPENSRMAVWIRCWQPTTSRKRA